MLPIMLMCKCVALRSTCLHPCVYHQPPTRVLHCACAQNYIYSARERTGGTAAPFPRRMESRMLQIWRTLTLSLTAAMVCLNLPSVSGLQCSLPDVRDEVLRRIGELFTLSFAAEMTGSAEDYVSICVMCSDSDAAVRWTVRKGGEFDIVIMAYSCIYENGSQIAELQYRGHRLDATFVIFSHFLYQCLRFYEHTPVTDNCS